MIDAQSLKSNQNDAARGGTAGLASAGAASRYRFALGPRDQTTLLALGESLVGLPLRTGAPANCAGRIRAVRAPGATGAAMEAPRRIRHKPVISVADGATAAAGVDGLYSRAGSWLSSWGPASGAHHPTTPAGRWALAWRPGPEIQPTAW